MKIRTSTKAECDYSLDWKDDLFENFCGIFTDGFVPLFSENSLDGRNPWSNPFLVFFFGISVYLLKIQNCAFAIAVHIAVRKIDAGSHQECAGIGLSGGTAAVKRVRLKSPQAHN